MRQWGILLACVLACAQAGAVVVNAPDERETQVTQPANGTTLSGTLRVATGQSRTPLMVLVAGSGGTDRNGNPWSASKGSNTLKMLADALAERGISTLRFDKRILPSATPPTRESDFRFGMLVDDVVAWVDRFAADPRFSRVVVVGHSEGGLVGAMAVQRSKAAGLVMVSAAGERLSDVLRRQVGRKAPPALAAENERILKVLESGKTTDVVPEPLLSLYRPVVQDYLISVFAVDPRAEIAKVRVPTLIVQGDTDIQVLVPDAQALAHSKTDAAVCIIGGMNHMLKDAPASDLSSYTNLTQPLDATVVNALAAFDAQLVDHKDFKYPAVEGCRGPER